MKIAANISIQSLATPASNVPAEISEAQDTYKKSDKGGFGHTLGRVVFYSTAAAIPGVGVVSNLVAATCGALNVAGQQKETGNSARNGALALGAGVLAIVPNVIGMVTHQAGWFVASMVIGGIAGAATAYHAKD